MRVAGVLEALDHREIGVRQRDVLADEADADRCASHESIRSTSSCQLAQVGLGDVFHPEVVDHELVEALVA